MRAGEEGAVAAAAVRSKLQEAWMDYVARCENTDLKPERNTASLKHCSQVLLLHLNASISFTADVKSAS